MAASSPPRLRAPSQRGDQSSLSYSVNYEFLAQPFPIAPGVTLPIGSYDFAGARASYTFGQQRKVAGTVATELGTFYNGTRVTVSASGVRVKFAPKLSMEPSYSGN